MQRQKGTKDMNKVQIYIVPSDSPSNIRLGDFKLVIDPSSLDDLDLYVLQNFTKHIGFSKDGKGKAERWSAVMFAGLKELVHRLGHELVYVENPTEEAVDAAKKLAYKRDTFGWIDMRKGEPVFSHRE
jgi:hypothetical protein